LSRTVPAPTTPDLESKAARTSRSGGDGARATARLAILGASGYSGQELARLALAHPGIEVAVLVSREHAGRPAAGMLPGLDPRGAGRPEVVAPSALPALLAAGRFDTLASCLPHGAWRALAAEQPALARGPARIVDLSSDFRADPAWTYGLPELFRAAIAGATRVANPGCYATAAALALAPAAAHLAGPVTVTALSGVTGAGRSASLRTSFVEADGGASLYKVGTVHAHVPEIERTLARLGAPVPLAFAPALVPMARGILLTAAAPLAAPLEPEQAHALYRGFAAGETFVRVLDPGAWPETRAVRGSNRCDLAVTTLHGGTVLLAAAAIDNLVKGAAGQALQNLNRMLGWPEDTALPVDGTPW
jgi:N-acetyl-gamma-glutamyl-phosphate reductase